MRRTHDFQSSVIQTPSRTPTVLPHGVLQNSLPFMALNMFKHMESLFRIFCEAELRFKMKMSFYIIADNLFVQKLVFSHPKETIKAL